MIISKLLRKLIVECGSSKNKKGCAPLTDSLFYKV
jgi:hypothetical protein